MSLIINHNPTALQAHRNLGLSGNGMTKAIEKLSSGFKINVGADDPSGLVISEQLRSQISGLERAVQNSSEAFNLIGIAEGALNEMNSILKKMRALAIHAASNGVTSPDQIAADQAEMDSGIDTLNRIANTTRYSDQYLLNGGKQLVYDDHTTVDEPTDHQLVDTKMTRVDQIFKRDGMTISVGFAGDENKNKANTGNSAKRAYLEADNAYNLSEIDGAYLTGDQEFTLTGTKGSQMFNFTKGQHIGKIVSGINNRADSTGIGATLAFASNVRIDRTSTGYGVDAAGDPADSDGDGMPDIDLSASYVKGQVQVYGADLNTARPKVSAIAVTDDASDAFRIGYNTDGDGKIYAKVVDVASGALEYYKDKECAMLIGKGDNENFSPTNNSGIPGAPIDSVSGIFMTIDRNNAKNLDVYEIAVIGQNMDNEKDMNVRDLAGFCDIGNAVMSGVNLGKNTSPEGGIHFRYAPLSFDAAGNAASFKLEAFTDGSFEPKYRVGSTGEVTVAAPPQPVRIESVLMENGEESGLNMTLNIPLDATGLVPNIEQSGSVEFTNLGARLYSTDYGSAETIRMQNNKGSLFYQYRSHDNQEKLMVEPDETIQVAGADARITLNGTAIFTTGLIANATTPDFSGMLSFNAGSLGRNTIAVTGYGDGKLYSKPGDLQGVEENEAQIERDARTFAPEAQYVADGAGTGAAYIDFSGMDPMAESRLTVTAPPAAPSTISITAVTLATKNGLTPGQISFTVNGVAAVSSAMSYEDMVNGVHLSEPQSLKGVFVKIAANAPAAPAATPATVEVTSGDPMIEVNTYATQPRGTTSEDMSNFLGGMQFQLGNTEGDQDRTIYSIPSMSMSNMGRIEWDGEEFNLQSILGGGKASLAKDPVMAMRILGQAVDDVSTLRARLGAFQSNMLQTNINSLNVAVENITKTESAIRDTDMAAASTEMTRYQIMQEAGTSMLAQANQTSRNVLGLIQ